MACARGRSSGAGLVGAGAGVEALYVACAWSMQASWQGADAACVLEQLVCRSGSWHAQGMGRLCARHWALGGWLRSLGRGAAHMGEVR